MIRDAFKEIVNDEMLILIAAQLIFGAIGVATIITMAVVL